MSFFNGYNRIVQDRDTQALCIVLRDENMCLRDGPGGRRCQVSSWQLENNTNYSRRKEQWNAAGGKENLPF